MVNYRWINKGEQVISLKIPQVERHYKATYVADLCIKLKNGDWSDDPVSVFWQEKPSQKTYSNYFGLFLDRSNKLKITDASSVAEGFWQGIEAEDGEIIFSRFRHDYRTSRDGTAMVDGGRDYIRYNGKPVRLLIIGPDFIVDEMELDGSIL